VATLARHPDAVIGLVDSVARVHGRFKGLFAELRDLAGLSEMEMTVLTAVVEAAHPPTVPQIGRSLGHARQVIQRASDQLVQGGLIEVAPNPDHKRALLLLPTAEGHSVKRTVDARGREIAADVLQSVDADRVRRATALLEEIRGGLEAHVRTLKGR
jgi:DNA-binding MarR family transcriptional regulator